MEHNRVVKIPLLSISPRGICAYNYWVGPRKKHYDELVEERKKFERNKNLRANSPNGKLSDKALKRMEDSIKWLLFMSREKKIFSRILHKTVKYRINFITVTLASEQRHSDQKIKSELWNQFLTELRQRYNMKHYVWRAERQKNGNLHFHLLTNVFIPWDELQKKWNRIQNKLGYVDRYSKYMNTRCKSFADYYEQFIGQGTYTQLMQRYIAGRATGFRNPNSTDIHSVKKVKNVAAYIMKYMAKRDQETAVNGSEIDPATIVSGKIWGLSESLSQLKSVQAHLAGDVMDCWNDLCERFKKRLVIKEHFEYLAISFKELVKAGAHSIMRYVFKEASKFNENTLQLC